MDFNNSSFSPSLCGGRLAILEECAWSLHRIRSGPFGSRALRCHDFGYNAYAKNGSVSRDQHCNDFIEKG